MAISTINTVLKYKSGSFVELCKIKDFPDMGGTPDTIEVTDLTDTHQRFIKGVISQDVLEFTANYDGTAFDLIDGLSGEQEFQLELSNTDTWEWKGEISVYLSGNGVNGPHEMVISIVPSTAIAKI